MIEESMGMREKPMTQDEKHMALLHSGRLVKMERTEALGSVIMSAVQLVALLFAPYIFARGEKVMFSWQFAAKFFGAFLDLDTTYIITAIINSVKSFFALFGNYNGIAMIFVMALFLFALYRIIYDLVVGALGLKNSKLQPYQTAIYGVSKEHFSNIYNNLCAGMLMFLGSAFVANSYGGGALAASNLTIMGFVYFAYAGMFAGMYAKFYYSQKNEVGTFHDCANMKKIKFLGVAMIVMSLIQIIFVFGVKSVYYNGKLFTLWNVFSHCGLELLLTQGGKVVLGFVLYAVCLLASVIFLPGVLMRVFTGVMALSTKAKAEDGLLFGTLPKVIIISALFLVAPLLIFVTTQGNLDWKVVKPLLESVFNNGYIIFSIVNVIMTIIITANIVSVKRAADTVKFLTYNKKVDIELPKTIKEACLQRIEQNTIIATQSNNDWNDL